MGSPAVSNLCQSQFMGQKWRTYGNADKSQKFLTIRPFNFKIYTEWLHIRIETHEELVNAIIAGDTRRVKIAVDKHAGSNCAHSPR